MEMDEVDRLFDRIKAGDAAANQELFGALYGELRALAARLFRSQRKGHTLQPTALVHEAFFKMHGAAEKGDGWQNRSHFFAVAARAMRQVLVNHARDKAALKRGGPDAAQRVTLSGVSDDQLGPNLEVLAVNDALEELGALDERQARIAELRLFGGFTNKECAEIVGISLRSVELDWRMAKNWLSGKLGND